MYSCTVTNVEFVLFVLSYSTNVHRCIDDLERVQKSACRIMLQEKYHGYKKALTRLDMETLVVRREELCLNFALKCTKSNKLTNMFPKNDKKHQMNTSNPDKFKVQFANTERLKNSSIIYMQKLLNDHVKLEQG